ncbi:restriction endonuclease [Rhizobium leguminosarum]|uniref:EcoAI/FtnUII family type I restriction enzme subunit R n=1 Tax=Rhizobium leguminosarum TaxID=384 RepID=UPI00102F92DF|nr:restriction endonuclease [Rhizobium leguminosarum]
MRYQCRAGGITLRLSERDVCSKYVSPALFSSGWDLHSQIREEVTLTAGRIIVRGQMTTRGGKKRADYVLYLKPNIPLAVIEVKDESHSASHGMQQALEYAQMLDVPFAFSTNGNTFVLHDRTGGSIVEKEFPPSEFPSPKELWLKYREWKNLDTVDPAVVEQDYFDDGSDRSPRYYQSLAINRAVERVSQGDDRLLLVMATGTGKTYTAFQIIWRLWRSGKKKRILFLADRNILVDQAKTNDFKPFGGAMTKITNRNVDKSYEIYLSLYQAITGSEIDANIYKLFSPTFFDLIIVDECHRGSATEDSRWREVLQYFASATQIGLTATPKETKTVSNSEYFGEPIYTYSLRQGIEDGFLAPYKVVRYDLDRDMLGYRPTRDTTDRFGNEVNDRIYRQKDFDRSLVLTERTKLVAKKVTEFLQATDPYSKTIVFCEDQEHAERMRRELININHALVRENHRYVMRITGEDEAGKAELDNFIDPRSRYPVIATTSKLLSTGVDAKTCKLIVLDQTIESMTEFKQTIGRGTRIDEQFDKLFFTIMDFRSATELFADINFDGDPVQIYEPTIEDPALPPEDEQTTEFPDTSPLAGDAVGAEKRLKYYLDDVQVDVLSKREQYLSHDGKLITESLVEYTKKTITQDYRTLRDFLTRWTEADKKQAVIDELANTGVSLDALRSEVPNGKSYSAFDLLCHVAYGEPAMTRRERADRLRGRGYFAKYQQPARTVLEALLDKYANEEFDPIENARVLQLKPFDEIGTPVEIVKNVFGGRSGYEIAVRELQDELYRREA